MLFTLASALFVIYFVWDYLNKKHRNEVLAQSNITGPKTLPILGNALQLRHVNTESEYNFIN